MIVQIMHVICTVFSNKEYYTIYTAFFHKQDNAKKRLFIRTHNHSTVSCVMLTGPTLVGWILYFYGLLPL